MRAWFALKGLFVVLLLAGCSASLGGFTFSSRQTDIAQIKIGDSPQEVTSKIGNPHEVITDEKSPQGRHKVVWGYQAVSEKTHSLTGGLRAPARYPVSVQKKSEANFGSSDYLVVFLDGKVDSVIHR